VRNVTISLDEETARWARIEAARRDTSLSRFVGDLLRKQMTEPEAYQRAQQSYLNRGPLVLRGPGQRYPTREEVHQR